jgi:periplasmic protein TonB
MFESQTIVPKPPKEEHALVGEVSLGIPPGGARYDAKQRRLMQVALALLVLALGSVLYRNRDFWFPDTQEADLDQQEDSSTAMAAPSQPAPAVAKAPTLKSKRQAASLAKPDTKDSNPSAPAVTTTARTVLPPLEVEVVAGDTRRTVRPGSNSVRVELQPGVPPQPAAHESGTASETSETAANLTSNAAERVQMSADTADVVTHPVKPGYPLLARQMKVQGSVILRAFIGKDGGIQDLHVLSGPAILASAAQDAVRQWRFRPHYQGSEAIETQAKITVNFTISTN